MVTAVIVFVRQNGFIGTEMSKAVLLSVEPLTNLHNICESFLITATFPHEAVRSTDCLWFVAFHLSH